jgi:hypothetical protein
VSIQNNEVEEMEAWTEEDEEKKYKEVVMKGSRIANTHPTKLSQTIQKITKMVEKQGGQISSSYDDSYENTQRFYMTVRGLFFWDIVNPMEKAYRHAGPIKYGRKGETYNTKNGAVIIEVEDRTEPTLVDITIKTASFIDYKEMV